jgi:hypothetical protein
LKGKTNCQRLGLTKSNDCKKEQTIMGAIEREGVNKKGKGKQEKWRGATQKGRVTSVRKEWQPKRADWQQKGVVFTEERA